MKEFARAVVARVFFGSLLLSCQATAFIGDLADNSSVEGAEESLPLDAPAAGGVPPLVGPTSGASLPVDDAFMGFGLDTRPAETSCLAGPRPASTQPIRLQPIFEAYAAAWDALADNRLSAVSMHRYPSGDRRWFAVFQGGVGRTWLEGDAADGEMFDLSGSVCAEDFELGLMGFAADPDFDVNHVAYLSFTSGLDANGCTGDDYLHIERVVFDEDVVTRSLSLQSRQTVLIVPLPTAVHHGGTIRFGLDQMLYVGIGDGGGLEEDPNNNAQNLRKLTGKFLRIDVRNPGSAGTYSVPSDNPFVGQDNVRQEIWAYGLRNPWMWEFDRVTGSLWAGDVGNWAREEVDRIVPGGNYGWRIMEGTLCWRPGLCDPPNSVAPVVEYDRRYVTGAVVSGPVYRGEEIESLRGALVFADMYHGIFLLPDADAVLSTLTWSLSEVRVPVQGLLTAFAQDSENELYTVSLVPPRVHKVVENQVAVDSSTVWPPALLSQTGCVLPDNPKQAAEGLVPYEVNAPFYSGHADKTRYVSIPANRVLVFDAYGRLEIPATSVTMKHFQRDGRWLETRLFVRHEDGSYAGYSYAWNEEETEAHLVGEARWLADIPGQDQWLYPSRNECSQCHNSISGYVLGLEQAQLERDVVYANGVTSDQIDTWVHIGLVDAPETFVTPLVDPHGDASLDRRAKSYLHANCSMCHQASGVAPPSLDLRWGGMIGGCNEPPLRGNVGPASKLIVPGDASASILVQRMQTLGAQHMPPFPGLPLDPSGIALISEWIDAMPDCRALE